MVSWPPSLIVFPVSLSWRCHLGSQVYSDMTPQSCSWVSCAPPSGQADSCVHTLLGPRRRRRRDVSAAVLLGCTFTEGCDPAHPARRRR